MHCNQNGNVAVQAMQRDPGQLIIEPRLMVSRKAMKFDSRSKKVKETTNTHV